VWAGVGCTFSVVILLSLFWKRYHGKAVVMTIISGILFTVFWISGGFEQNYKVTGQKTDFLIQQNVIDRAQAERILALEGQRFISSAKFEASLKKQIEASGDDKKLSVISGAFIRKGVPARLTTFLFSLIVAVFSTLILPVKKNH